jgi:hypothetical protein
LLGPWQVYKAAQLHFRTKAIAKQDALNAEVAPDETDEVEACLPSTHEICIFGLRHVASTVFTLKKVPVPIGACRPSYMTDQSTALTAKQQFAFSDGSAVLPALYQLSGAQNTDQYDQLS